MKAIAELLVAQLVPLSCRRREELLRFGPASGDGGLEPAMILRCGRARRDLLADQLPQSPRRLNGVAAVRASLAADGSRRARHRVEVARTFRPRRDPSAVGERFQVTADRGL